MNISLYDCVSPLDYRYYGGEPKLVELLGPHLTDAACIRSELEVEAAAVRALARRGVCSQDVADEVTAAVERVRPEDVHAEDARIHHDTRALVNCLQAQVSEAARPFIHLSLPKLSP